MLSLIGNLQLTELMLVAIVAILIFGKDLPRVVAQAVVRLRKFRRMAEALWRETGIEEEIRNVQREVRDVEARVKRETADDFGSMARDNTSRESTGPETPPLVESNPPPEPPSFEGPGPHDRREELQKDQQEDTHASKDGAPQADPLGDSAGSEEPSSS